MARLIKPPAVATERRHRHRRARLVRASLSASSAAWQRCALWAIHAAAGPTRAASRAALLRRNSRRSASPIFTPHSPIDDTGAIMALRGGYGSNYLLDGLDLAIIADHPKPFFAYSDLTGIQLHLLDQLGLPAFHGPMLAADFYLEDGVHLDSFRAALAGEPYTVGAAEGLRILSPAAQRRRRRSTAAASAFSFRCSARPGSRAPKASCSFSKTPAPSPIRSTACCGNCARRASSTASAASSSAKCSIAFLPAPPPICSKTSSSARSTDSTVPSPSACAAGHVSRQNVTLTFGVEAELTLGPH